MKLPKFRNAIVYRATLPSIEAIEGHLLELPTPRLVKLSFHAPLLCQTRSLANWSPQYQVGMPS